MSDPMFEALKAGAVCHQQIKEWLLHDIDPEYRIVTVPRCEGCPGCKARALVREIEEANDEDRPAAGTIREAIDIAREEHK